MHYASHRGNKDIGRRAAWMGRRANLALTMFYEGLHLTQVGATQMLHHLSFFPPLQTEK